MEHHYDTAKWIKMSLTLSSGMAVDDLPDVTEPPRDGMSIHEVRQSETNMEQFSWLCDSVVSCNIFSSPVSETQVG